MSHFFDGFRRLRLLVYHMPGVSATSPLLQSELCDLPDAEFDHRIVEEIVIHHAISIAGSDIDFGTPRQWPWEEASTPSARLRILREAQRSQKILVCWRWMFASAEHGLGRRGSPFAMFAPIVVPSRRLVLKSPALARPFGSLGIHLVSN